MSAPILALTLAVLALARSQAADPTADEWSRLWDRGERVEAVDGLALELDRRPNDTTLRARYVDRALTIHRYQAALDAMGPARGSAANQAADEFAHLRGLVLYHLARYDEAVQHLVATDELQVLMLVDSFEALGRLDEAARALDAAEERLGPQHSRILCLRAAALQRSGDHARAVELFRTSLERDAWDAEALFGLGQSLIRTGEREEGLAVLTRHRELAKLLDELDYAYRGIDLAPNHAQTRAHAADLERQIGRLDRADALYRTALRLATDEELVPIVLRAARLLVEDRSDLDGATELLDAATKRVPDPRLFVRAGDHQRSAGRPKEALKRYEQARALRPNDTAVRARIAQVRAEIDE